MAFKSSKFNMPTYSGSGFSNRQDWGDDLLTKVKNAFIDASSAWGIETGIETIGTNTNTNCCTRTLQIKSSTSGKYVRIWCFCGNDTVKATFVDNETESGGYNALKIYKGNVFKCNDGSYTNRCLFGENYNRELVFAVSSQSINKDFGLDLSLDAPLFCVENNYMELNSTCNLSAGSSYGMCNKGGTVSIMTDGSMFSIMRLYSGASDLSICLYSPDLMVCINPGDSNTEGIISNKASTNNFYLGNNDPYNAESYIRVLFNAADGTRDFAGMGCDIYNGKGPLCCSESCTKLLTTALQVQMWPVTYSGSTMTGVINGIGMKGWVNTDYIRSASITQLPNSNKGLKFGNGNWLCTDAGTLICWDDSNSSPFEAAT